MINIGGKERNVKYNFNAIIEFEELTGVDLASNEDAKLFTRPKSIRALAYCGLKHGALVNKETVDFTLEDVGGWLDSNNIAGFFQAYTKDNSADGEAQNTEGEASKK